MAQPTLLMVSEALYEAMNQILDAMGRGPENITREVVAVGTPSLVLYRVGLDMGADADYATALRAMAEAQTLPEIEGEWGAGGAISAADAQAAMLGFQAFTAAGAGIDGLEWVNTVLTGMGLQFAPAPED